MFELSELKKGDMLRCISPRLMGNFLTTGEVYSFDHINPLGNYMIRNKKGKLSGGFKPDRFEKAWPKGCLN